MVLVLASLLVIMATAGTAALAPAEPAIHYYTIYEFTDESAPVLVRVRAEAVTVSVEYRGTFRSAVLPMTMVDSRGVYEVIIPGDDVAVGTLHYRVVAHGRGRRVVTTEWTSVTVQPRSSTGPDRDWLGDDVSILSSPVRIFYDSELYGNWVNGVNIGNIASTLHNPYVGSWPGVNSQVNATRPSGYSSPHRGLDLAMSGGAEVRAVLGGKIRDTKEVTYTQNGQQVTYWFLTIGHDLDPSLSGEELFSNYQHLRPSDVPQKFKVEGATVAKGELIGKICSSYGNNHLHIEFRDKVTTPLRLPQYTFWLRDEVDMINKPAANPSTGAVSVTAYIRTDAGTAHFPQGAVKLHCRVWPDTVYTTINMTRNPNDPKKWTAQLPLSGDIEYYISARRFSSEPTKLSYRPMYYGQYQSGGSWVSTPPPVNFYVYR